MDETGLMCILAKIINPELASGMAPILKRRVLFVNSLLLASILIAACLIIMNIVIQAYSSTILNVITALCFCGLLWLNHKRKYGFVILTSINFATLAIATAEWIGFEEGRFVENENFLYAVLLGAVFLLDKHKVRIQSLLIVLVLIGAKT